VAWWKWDWDGRGRTSELACGTGREKGELWELGGELGGEQSGGLGLHKEESRRAEEPYT